MISKYEGLWIRLRLEFLALAEGSTSNYTGDQISHSGGKSKAPPPAGIDLRDLEERWAGCRTEPSRRAVVWAAIEALRTYKLPNPDIRQKRGTEEWRKAIAADPRPARTVARMYGVSHSTVLRHRREFAE